MTAYRETFSQKLVINLASKITTRIKAAVDGPAKGTVTSVAAVVSELSYLRKLVRYANASDEDWFTALVHTEDMRVLVYGDKPAEILFDNKIYGLLTHYAYIVRKSRVAAWPRANATVIKREPPL